MGKMFWLVLEIINFEIDCFCYKPDNFAEHVPSNSLGQEIMMQHLYISEKKKQSGAPFVILPYIFVAVLANAYTE